MASSASPACIFVFGDKRVSEGGQKWRALGNKGDLHTRCSIMILPPLSLSSLATPDTPKKREAAIQAVREK